jgi:acyl-CoA synthetase (AMP-forming)/AMP-acid ligase II
LEVVELQIFDDDGMPVSPGTVGEIVVRGPLVFLGYWRDEDATRFAGRHGWHHTGDLGSLDEEGHLYYSGRKPEKDLIKSGGENIYPAEVEQVISRLPQVRAVCVIGIPDKKWGEAVQAVIELEPGNALTPEEVLKVVGEELASYKKPRNVVFVDQLPHDAKGHIDRAAVKARYGSA